MGRAPGGTRGGRRCASCWRSPRVCFALGMVQKSGCYEDDWSDDDARYTHMCYSDLPYLYTGRGLVELDWPYTDDTQVRARYEVMEYPVGIAYFAYGAAWVTQGLTGAGRGARADEPAGDLVGTPRCSRRCARFVIVNALGFAAMALLSAWLLAGVNPRPAVGRRRLRRLAGAAAHRPHQLGHARGGPASRARCWPGRAAGRCSPGC